MRIFSENDHSWNNKLESLYQPRINNFKSFCKLRSSSSSSRLGTNTNPNKSHPRISNRLSSNLRRNSLLGRTIFNNNHLQLFLYSSSSTAAANTSTTDCAASFSIRVCSASTANAPTTSCVEAFSSGNQNTNNRLCNNLFSRHLLSRRSRNRPSPPAPTPPKQPHYPMPAEEPQPKGFIQQVPQQLPHLYQKQDQSAYVARWESHSTWSNPNEAEVTCQDSKSCRGFKGGSKMFMEEEEPSASHRYMAKKK
ncbi:hypothetical protein NW767_014789, partial [Fusarium falciforme]